MSDDAPGRPASSELCGESVIRICFFLWKRPGISTDEFRSYYEGPHASLIGANVPTPLDYRRNYPDVAMTWGDEAGERSFDVMTTITYPDVSGAGAALKAYSAQPFNDLVVADELHFIDRERMKLFMAEEVAKRSCDDWQPQPVGNEVTKFLRLVCRPPRMARDLFRRLYEEVAETSICPRISPAVDYRRSYVVDLPGMMFETPAITQEASRDPFLRCDLIEELTFPAQAGVSPQDVFDALKPGNALDEMQCSPLIVCSQGVSRP